MAPQIQVEFTCFACQNERTGKRHPIHKGLKIGQGCMAQIGQIARCATNCATGKLHKS
jgi:hypothetical protein